MVDEEEKESDSFKANFLEQIEHAGSALDQAQAYVDDF